MIARCELTNNTEVAVGAIYAVGTAMETDERTTWAMWNAMQSRRKEKLER